MGKKTNSYIKVLLLIYIFMSISSFGILAFANEQEELDYFVYKAYEALDEKNYDSAIDSVSYTHLDVYKRQIVDSVNLL